MQPVIDAGLVDAVAADTALTPQVRLRRNAGTHPRVYECVDRRPLLITGDILHHPIQCGHPDWTARGDLDPEMARRRDLGAATTNALVLGTHFAGTSAGRVLSADDGYSFVPETHTYTCYD